MKRNVMKTKATFTLKSATRGKTVALFRVSLPMTKIRKKKEIMKKETEKKSSCSSGQTESFA